MASLELSSLPNELAMEIISWLPLKSLIATRGLNHHWQHLISIATILPARRKLFTLFLKAIAHVQVTDIIESIRPHLRQIDRLTYVASLESKIGGIEIPDEFRVWVLEWPSAVLGWTWPGLDVRSFDAAALINAHGFSRLSHLYILVEDVVIAENIRGSEGEHLRCEKVTMQAIEVYKGTFWSHWLVLGGSQKSMLGMVRAIPEHQNHLDRISLVHVVEEMERLQYSGWVDWLSTQLKQATDGRR